MGDDMPMEKRARKAGRARGGEARAHALPPARLSEIGKSGAAARWNPDVRTAEYGDDDHPLMLGGIKVPCYVLDNGKRVLSQRGFLDVLGIKSSGTAINRLIAHGNLEAHLSKEAIQDLKHPLRVRPRHGGSLVTYEGTLLVDVCNAILTSRDSGSIDSSLTTSLVRADVIVRAVAKVGIIALIDEATGYIRKELLQTLLDRYLRAELARWTKTFPDEFYEQIFRLRGWKWNGRTINPPGIVAHYTKDLVYMRLAPNILESLEKLNPKVDGRRKGTHTQWLTNDVGTPALKEHLYAVVRFMRIADSWEQLMSLMNRAMPRFHENSNLPLLEWGKEGIIED